MADKEKTDEPADPTNRTLTKWIMLTSTVLIGVYLIASSLWWVDNPVIGGRSKLMVQDSVLHLSLKPQFKILEIYFSEKFASSRDPQFGTIAKIFSPFSSTDCTTSIIGNIMVRVAIINDSAIKGQTDLIVYFRERGRGDIPKRRFIKSVRMDGKQINLKDFYENFLITDQSNVEYYKPLDIRNISNTLENIFGESLVLLVTFILLVMLGAQIFIIMMSFIKQLLPQLYTEVGGKAIFPVNWIDGFAKNYSMLFGFLGTILSIWVSSRDGNTDYGDFFQMLNMVKFAVFTTVLGLMVRIAYEVRVYLSGLYSEGREDEK